MSLTIDSDIGAAVPFELRPVSRRRDVTREQFRRDIQPAGRPVLVEGAMADWRAIESWTDRDRLAELIGDDTTVYCRRIVTDAASYQEDFYPVRFGDFLDEFYVRGESDHYLTQALVFEPVGFLRKFSRDTYTGLLQQLAEDCAVPAFLEVDEIAEGVMWMGTGGHVTPLHYDPVENLYCTIMGHKRWILFPADESPNLVDGADGADGSEGMLSSLDVLAAGGAWRGGEVAEAYEVETRPGEMLYLPAGYNHHVFSSPEPSAAINFWFIDPRRAATYRSYSHHQSRYRYGDGRPVRRRAYATGLMLGMLGLRGVYLVAPKLIPTPDIGVGAASYERHAAT